MRKRTKVELSALLSIITLLLISIVYFSSWNQKQEDLHHSHQVTSIPLWSSRPTTNRVSGPLLGGSHVPISYYKVTLTRVKDADTIVGTIRFPWNVALVDESIRAAGFDAWEVSRKRRTVHITDEELRKGKEAKLALISYLKGKHIYITPLSMSRDAYGRIFALIFVGEVDRAGRYVFRPLADWAEKNHFVRKEIGEK